MHVPSPRAGARVAALALATAAALSGPALGAARPLGRAGAAPRSARVAGTADRSLTIAVLDLPPGRRTLAQIAAYYYGARQLSIVLAVANPRLAGLGPDRRLPVSGPHAAVRIPVLRGPRPLGPS